MILKLTIAIIVLINFDCEVEGRFYLRQSNGRIVGGNVIGIEQASYLVSLQSHYFNNHECGGSYIGEGADKLSWILTAAHCTEDPDRKYFVRVGSSLHAEGGHIFNVTKVINHKKFVRKTMDFDIALLKLDGQITSQTGGKKINLPQQDESVPNGMLVKVSGWGRTNNPNESRDIVRSVDVPIFDHATCTKNYKQYYEGDNITDNMICAGGNQGQDACQMDSGGPLVYQNTKLIGIVSWGEECGNKLFPGIYTRVSALRNWIQENSGI